MIGMAKHSQSSQNNKFEMSVKNLKKKIKIFLHADKHQSFLQGDIIITDGHDQAFLKYSK